MVKPKEYEMNAIANSALAEEHPVRVELRFAEAADGDAVARLAALDEERELEGRVLMALVDGHAVAAVSLGDARAVADPFVASADLVAMLRLRAEQLVDRRPTDRLARRRARAGWLKPSARRNPSRSPRIPAV